MILLGDGSSGKREKKTKSPKRHNTNVQVPWLHIQLTGVFRNPVKLNWPGYKMAAGLSLSTIMMIDLNGFTRPLKEER